MSILNAELILELRLANGLSPRDLARALNLSTVAIRSLEQGRNHSQLTLHRAELLAHTLGVPLVDLVNREDGGAQHEAAADDLKVEAALALAARKLHPKDLAMAFSWNLKRTLDALAKLRQRRAGTAMRVHITGGRYHLVPARSFLTDDEVQTLTRTLATQGRISTGDAQLLKTAIEHHPDGWDGQVHEARRPGLAHLIKLGWIEHRNGRYFPTPEVVSSLGLCHEPPRPRRSRRSRERARSPKGARPSRKGGSRS